MFADYIYVITETLTARHSHNEQISDRLLADIGLTRAEFARRSRRKASNR